MPEEIKKLLDCSKCNLKECIGCEITYTDRKKIREYIAGIEHDKEIMQKSLELQTVGWNQGAKLFAEKQKLIKKLEEDIVNITKTMQDEKHCDDYSRNRLQAYRTKTKEILAILKGEKEVCN